MFAAITFLSAFLLFVVEPMLGKHLLPWFGGTPAVWTTCMLFFQILLLLGYLYAHLTDRYLGVRAQGRLHAALLLLSVLALGWFALKWGAPLLPGSAWRPASPDAPIAHILLVLTAAVGLPFFLLSSTSPLIQRWYAVVRQESFPYRLYALSNAGSLIGLLSYPFLLEPAASMPVQAALWTACYACFAAPCAIVALRLPASAAVSPAAAAVHEGDGARPAAATMALWFVLAACASAMLLSVTNSLCLEVAAVPFLWVVPLALYLLTFILCFQNPRGYAREWYLPLTALLTLAVLMTHMLGVQLRMPAHVLSFSLFLFAFCMTCHGELVRLRPSVRHLTLFYLAAAAGGAAGGVFVGVIAPYGFTGFREFHISVLAGWLALLAVLSRDRASPLFTGDRRHAAALLLIAVYVGLRYLLPAVHAGRIAGSARVLNLLHVGLALAVAGPLIAAVWRRPWMNRRLWPRILIGLVLFMAECFLLRQMRGERLFSMAQTRNFYGVLRVDTLTVTSGMPSRNLIHGRINHGFQLLSDEWRRKPVGYYAPNSGVGLAMRFHPRRTGAVPQPFRLGVTGLGAGGLAAYASTNDVIRFYEINPAVIEYAAGPKAFFTYVSECAGKVEIVTGDARLSQERELRESGSERYDVLVLDAFSSDSVPVHLLTMEALGVCLAHLRDEDAILAVNISNRFLDLRPLMFAQARRLGLEAGLFRCAGEAPQPTMSLWVLMTRNRAFFDQAEVRAKRIPYQPARDTVWTDSYSGLFRLLRFD